MTVVYTPLVTVPALPVTLPLIAFVTVKSVSVPTLVKLELTTLLARVVPVSALAAPLRDVCIVILPPRLTGVPLIVIAELAR